MAEERSLKLNITSDSSRAVRNVNKFNKSLKDTEKQNKALDKSFKILKIAVSAFLAVLAVKKITAFVNETIKLYQTQELAEKSFRQAAISAGKFTEEFYQGTLKMASGLQKLTGVGDETILEASKILVSFDKISKDALPEVTKAVLDFSRSAGITVKSAAQIIGKASIGMVDSLRRYGVEVSKAELKTKGFGAVIEAVYKKAGGQAENFRRTSAGQWAAFRNVLGDLKEQFGEIFDTIFTKTGLLDAFTRGISEIVKILDEFQENKQMVVWAKTTAILVLRSFQSIAEGFFKIFGGITKWVMAIRKISMEDLYKRLTRDIEMIGKNINKFSYVLVRSEANLKDAIEKRTQLLTKYKRQQYEKGFLSSLFLISESDIEKANKRVKDLGIIVDRNKKVVENLKKNQETLVESYKKGIGESLDWMDQTGKLLDDIIASIENLSLDIGKKTEKSLKKLYTTLSTVNKEVFESVFGKQKELFEELKIDIGIKLKIKPEDVDFEGVFDAVDEINDRIRKLTLSEYEYKVHMIDKEIEKYRELGVVEIKLTELRNLEISKLNEEMFEETTNMYENLAEGITDSFTSAFKEILTTGKLDFEKLGESIIDVFADVISQMAKKQFIEPIINQIMTSMTGKQFGPLPQGGQKQATPWASMIGGGLVAGAIGANIYQQQQAGQLTTLGGITQGAMAGAALGSVIPGIGTVAGAVFGGLAGAATSFLKKGRPKQEIDKNLNLLFKTIGDEIKLIGNKYQYSEKTREVIKAIEETLESQLEFFNKIMELTEKSFGSINIAFSSLESRLTKLVTGERSAFLLSTMGKQQFEQMFPTFGEEYTEMFAKTFEPIVHRIIYGVSAGRTPEVAAAQTAAQAALRWQMPEKALSEFQKVIDNLAKTPDQLQKFFEQIYTFQKIGGKQYRLYLSEMISEEDWDEFFEEYRKRFEEITQSFGSIIGSAFLSTIDTGDYKNFINTLKINLQDSIKSALAIGFSRQIIDRIFAETGLFGATGILAQYMEGKAGIGEVETALTASIDQLNNILPELEPIWQSVSNALENVNESLNINTNAMVSNTEAILGPIDSFLKSLEYGELAPVKSIAKLAEIEKILYAQTLADPTQFSEYASFMESQFIPSMEGITDNYAGLIAGIREDVLAVREIVQPTAEENAKAIAKELGPMFKEIAENEDVEVNVYIGNEKIDGVIYQVIKGSRDIKKFIKNI